MNTHSDWPMGTTTVTPLRGSSERELSSMLRRANNHLASLALLDLPEEVKRTALAFVRESKALLQRVEPKR
jgi:hypothetical protein